MVKSTTKISVPGFLANGISVGIKGSDQKDLALIYSTIPAKVAAVFTKNTFKAAHRNGYLKNVICRAC